MMDPTAPVNDGVDGWMALCENGIMANGWHCTGSAHLGSQFIRCSDPSHKVTGFMIEIPPGGLMLSTGIPSTSRPSTDALSDYLGDLIRRSHQVGTMGWEGQR